MQYLSLNGEAVMTLTDLVDDFCLAQGNMRESTILAQYRHARWAWKELFRKTLWIQKNQVLDINCEDHTIVLPKDCDRLINIYVLDRQKKLQPLTCDPSISTVEITCIKTKCSCNTCNGQGTLCAAAESGITYSTETITIQGQQYTQETWVRYLGGAIQQQQKIPTLTTNNVVEYITNVSTICNIEVTDRGCIKPTPENMELLRNYCGCDTYPENQTGRRCDWYRNTDLIPQPYNYWGYWNVNAADSSIIHIFRHQDGYNDNHFNSSEGNVIDKVIVSYQTNGESPGQEILIPEYAVQAVQLGIMHQQKLFNTRESAGNKEYALQQWLRAKLDVNKYLNPIRLEDLAKLQTQLRRW